MALDNWAVLWDMDGTLVDSEVLWDKAIYNVMEEVLGATLTNDQRRSTVGMSMPRLVEALLQFSDYPLSDEHKRTVEEEIISRMVTFYKSQIVWRPGAQELLLALQEEGVPQALVTNTQRVLVDVAISTIGEEHFAASVCGDEVQHGKPAPDSYRRAAELLHLSPSQCVVLEDSATGVAAGVAAGCSVIGIPSEVPLEESDSYTLWQTLEGVDVCDLAALLSAECQS